MTPLPETVLQATHRPFSESFLKPTIGSGTTLLQRTSLAPKLDLGTLFFGQGYDPGEHTAYTRRKETHTRSYLLTSMSGKQ